MQLINAGYKILIFSDQLWNLAGSFITIIHYWTHKLHIITKNNKQTNKNSMLPPLVERGMQLLVYKCGQIVKFKLLESPSSMN